jgi:hypothetical protein
LFRILDVLNTAFFLGAIIGILKGVISILKGLKIIVTGKKARLLGSLVEILIPDRFKNQLAAFLLWTGGAELALSSLVIFITAIANNVAIYLLAKGVCDTEVNPYGVEVSALDIGDIPDVLDMTWQQLMEASKNDQ